MRNFTLFLLFIFATQFCSAQSDTNKYRLNLPGYWKPGNKAWRILDDKLPLVCDELKNKDLCGDNCNAMYVVDFDVTEPEILDYYAEKRGGSMYHIITLYYFQSNLYVRNRKGEIVTRIILVDTNEVHKKITHLYYDDYYVTPTPLKTYIVRRPGQTPRLVVANEERFAPTNYTQGGRNSESPYSYINKNKEKLKAGEREMYSVIDKKIAALDH